MNILEVFLHQMHTFHHRIYNMTVEPYLRRNQLVVRWRTNMKNMIRFISLLLVTAICVDIFSVVAFATEKYQKVELEVHNESNYHYENIGDTEEIEPKSQVALTPLSIVRQPVDCEVDNVGDMAVIDLEAKGEGLTYQWYVSNKGIAYDVSAVKSNTYKIKVTEKVNGRFLYCVVKDKNGYEIQSNIVKIKIREPENSYLLQNGKKTTHGIVYTGENGTWHIYGTADGAGFISLSGGINKIPDWMRSGDIISISFNSDSSARLVFRGFTEEYPKGTTLLSVHESTVYKIPDLSKFKGVDIRLQVPGNAGKVDTVVTPNISRKLPYYGKPCLTIIDDDGDIHFKTDVLPLIKELGVNISTAVTTTRIGSGSKWMNWEEIMDCHRNGAEVLCHTYSHPTAAQLNQWTDQELVNRLTMARDNLLSRRINTGDILVYSSSTGYVKRMRQAASSVFKAGIVIGGHSVNNQNSDVYNLKRYRIDFTTGDGDKTKRDWNIKDMKDYIDVVAACGGFQIMMFHTSSANWRQLVQVDSEGKVLLDKNGNPIPLLDSSGNKIEDIDGSRYSQTYGHLVYVPILREIILYAQSKGVEIVSANEGIGYYYGK